MPKIPASPEVLHLLPGLDIAIIIDICLWSLGVWGVSRAAPGHPGLWITLWIKWINGVWGV